MIVEHIRSKLGFSKPEKEARESPAKNEEGKAGDNIELHVSNISLKTSEDDLRKLFEKYGEISRIKMLKRQNMHKAFIDMDSEKAALSAIDELDNYDFLGQRLEVRFTDAETARQYPASKFKRRREREFRDNKRDGYRGDRKDYRDDRGGNRSARGGDDRVKRRNTYDYDRRDYDRGGRKYDDDYYDYDEEDYDYEDDRRGDGSYRRHGEKDGYKKRDNRDYNNDRYGGGGRDYKGGDSWRDGRDYSKGYDKFADKPFSKSTPEQTKAENEERVLYVNNLNYDTREAGLEKAFGSFGKIERVVIGYRRDGRSLGNAQIQFKNKYDAQ